MNLQTLVIVGIVVIASIFYMNSQNSWVDYDKTVAVVETPVQKSTELMPFSYKDVQIHPVAEFSLEARVLSKKRYRLGVEGPLAPYDFALGWGPMSSYDVLKHFKIIQGGRWYMYFFKDQPIPMNDIIGHSANMHLIPANDEVLRVMHDVRRGEIIRLKGYLVNITREDGWHWNTSQTRNDSGAGACELIWVEEMELAF